MYNQNYLHLPPNDVFEAAVFFKLNSKIDKVVIWSFDYPIKLIKDKALYNSLLKNDLSNDEIITLNHEININRLKLSNIKPSHKKPPKPSYKTHPLNLSSLDSNFTSMDRKNEDQEGTLYALYYFFTKLLKKKCEIILEPPIDQDCSTYEFDVADLVNKKNDILQSLTQNSLLIMLGEIDINSQITTIHSSYKKYENKYRNNDLHLRCLQAKIETPITKIALDLSANPKLHNNNDSLIIINYSSFSKIKFIMELNTLLKILNVNAVNLGYGEIEHNFKFKHKYTYEEIIEHFLKSEMHTKPIVAYKYINANHHEIVGLNTTQLKNLAAFTIPSLFPGLFK